LNNIGLECSSLVDPPASRLEDLPIQAQDNEKRHVKRGARCEDLVGDILARQTPLLFVDSMQVVGIFPAELRRQRNHQGHSPYQKDHCADAGRVAGVDIVHLGHSPVPAHHTTPVLVHSQSIEKRPSINCCAHAQTN